ncbi:AaceriAER326Cp [[Ashbya] aceris (nom. inval.)]|nr:AaceriAER326Cp [[Ashbya] aceris (nom. inval.)]
MDGQRHELCMCSSEHNSQPSRYKYIKTLAAMVTTVTGGHSTDSQDQDVGNGEADTAQLIGGQRSGTARKANRMLLGLLEDSSRYDMKSDYSLPDTWLRKRRPGAQTTVDGEAESIDTKKTRTTGKKVKPSGPGPDAKRKPATAPAPTNCKKEGTALAASRKASNGQTRAASSATRNTGSTNVGPFEPSSDDTIELGHQFFRVNAPSAGIDCEITSSLLLTPKDIAAQQIVRLHFIRHPEVSEEYKVSFEHPNNGFFNPIHEIGKCIKYAVEIYFPKTFKKRGSKLLQQLSSAYASRDQTAFVQAVEQYNDLVRTIPQSQVSAHLQQTNKIPRAFIHDILQIAYSRCVLPNVSGLKEYRSFSNFVYGELLPTFLSTVYQQCSLKPGQIFIDLGSGVGNCVVQASLEYGCALSFGCEIMKNASTLAEEQLKELEKRCVLWGIDLKPIEFSLRKSFIDNDRVNALLPQCDVLLINNFIFDSKLNQAVEKLIQGLKPGCKIITLRNLRPSGYTINFDDVENILNRLKVEKFTLPEDSVSWTYRGGGEYFISTVQADIDESVFHSYAKGRVRGMRPPKYTR